MPELDDQELLSEFAGTNSDAAFAALVARHVNLVYSTAVRFTGNSQAAEEISQAVFIILAHKAGSLKRGTILSGWLYRTARLTAANYVKYEVRRQRREQEAYMQSTMNEGDAAAWAEIAPLLDEAMGRLGETDRNAIVLRFFERKTSREVAAALKLTEAAAHKRVSRALEKLRGFFAKRGIVSTTAIIAGTVSANSVHAAPVGLAGTITAAALAKGAAASISTLTLAKGAMKMMAWSKAKTAVAIGVGLLLAAGATTVTVNEIHKRQNDEWRLGPLSNQWLLQRPYRAVILPTTASEIAERVRRATHSVNGRGYGTGTGGTLETQDGRGYGINQSVEDMLRYAATEFRRETGEILPDRIILDTELVTNRYDYFSNLPQGAQNAIMNRIERKFNLEAKLEPIDTNVLLLKVKFPNWPGLSASRRLRNAWRNGFQDGYISFQHSTMDNLAYTLEDLLGIPVIDRTGLTKFYAFTITWDGSWGRPKLGSLRQALTNQLGLELVPTNMPIKMLVVDKVK